MDNQRLLEAVAACQAGDNASFGIIYDYFIGKIYAFLYYRVFHKDTAEDLTSTTFFKALNHIKDFDPGKGTLQAWLYRIAHNCMIDHFRAAKETAPLDEALDISTTERVDQAVGNRMMLERIREFHDTLPKEQKDLILMRVWDGLSYAEISEITGKTENALKMSVSRIMAKVRGEKFLSFIALAILILK